MKLFQQYWWVLLLGFGIGSWAIAQEIGQETLEAQTSKIAAGVVQLQKIHADEDAKEKGKKEAIQELCDDGRLTGNICDEE